MDALDVEIILAAAGRKKRQLGSSNAVVDAVASVGALDLGLAPAMAEAMSFAALSQALTGAAHHAAALQEQANVILQTSTTVGVGLVLDSAPRSCDGCGAEDGCGCYDPGPRRPVAVRPRRRARR